jgi:hypothetical protein
MERPGDYLEVEYKKQPKKLFMSFMRLNSCIRVLGDPDRLPVMAIDPDISENILATLLADKPNDGLNLELGEDDISTDDSDKMLGWAQSHLSFFYLKRFHQMGTQAKALEPLAEHLKLSLSGSAP